MQYIISSITIFLEILPDLTIQIIRKGVAPNVGDKSIVLSPGVRGGELIFRDDVVIAQGWIDW